MNGPLQALIGSCVGMPCPAAPGPCAALSGAPQIEIDRKCSCQAGMAGDVTWARELASDE